VFSEDELAQLRGFPEPARAQLIRYFTLAAGDEAFVRQFRGPGQRPGRGGTAVHAAVAARRVRSASAAHAWREAKALEPPAAAGNLKPITHKRGDTLDQEDSPPAPVVPPPGTVTDTVGQGTTWRTVRLTEPSIRVRAPWIGASSGTIVETCVETRHLAELLGGGSPRSAAGVGYLLKDRVADVGEFIDALARVAGGGTALDPEVISELIGASGRSRALESLTPREREVLALMAEGRSNAAIAQHLVVSERAIQKHISSIFLKLDLPPSEADHRRVLAVLEYLRS
jgi:DNA-binding CsgD family transcriptional regulator